MLEGLGLNDTEAIVYRNLLLSPGRTVAELSLALGMSDRRVRRVVAELEVKGLVSRATGRPPRFDVPPPELALEALASRREGEVKRARLEIDALLRDLPSQRARKGALPPVDLVSGFEAARQRWVQIQRGAKAEVCIIDRPPHVMTTEAPNPIELDLLTQGIKYRLLYDGTSLELPGRLDIITTCVAAGEQARVAEELPLKLVMADASVALTYDVEGNEIIDGLVVHPSPLLDALVRLFNLLWEQATPFPASPGAKAAAELDESDRTILALLASGAQDEVIARRLGIALRTVGRRIARLMDVLGAKTRFQIALNAKERGWI